MSDILLFKTYAIPTTILKHVPFQSNSTILNVTQSSACTFVREDADGFLFYCSESHPVFAMLTLIFILLPFVYVIPTLLGAGPAGHLVRLLGLDLFLAGFAGFIIYFCLSSFGYFPSRDTILVIHCSLVFFFLLGIIMWMITVFSEL